MISNIIKEVRKKNLRKLIDEQLKCSVNAFAKKVNRPSGFFYDAFANRRPLGERVMRGIEADIGLMPNELDRMDEGIFEYKKSELINVYSSKLSTGKGGKIFDEKIIDQTSINAALMLKNGWKKEQLCCFDISGNSMEPTLRNGSRILVNTVKSDIIDSKIYALRKGNEIFIKRLYKVFNENKVIAKSDNPLYPELHFDLKNEDFDYKIVGMAVLQLEVPL